MKTYTTWHTSKSHSLLHMVCFHLNVFYSGPLALQQKHFQHSTRKLAEEETMQRSLQVYVEHTSGVGTMCERGSTAPPVCAQWETDALMREMVCPTFYVVGKLRGWQLTLSDRKLKEVATKLSSTYLSLTVEQCWRRPHPSLINCAVNNQAKSKSKSLTTL